MAPPVRVAIALEAMATRFELVLHGEDVSRVRAAGEEAFREIERLEGQLSFYERDSELRWINGRASREPVRVEPGLFRLLQACVDLTAATDGAFDVTVGPLMRAWKFVGASGAPPEPDALPAARACAGAAHVRLDTATRTVQFDRPGVELDLGAAGKGYAIDVALARLRENGIGSALLHGGTSSVHAIGAPPGQPAWNIAWRPPGDSPGSPLIVALADRALAVSAAHGKAFTASGRQYGHVLDPRTGEPVQGAVAAGVTGPSSFRCDALATALLVLGAGWLPTLIRRFPEYAGWVASGPPDAPLSLATAETLAVPLARSARPGP